MRKRSIILLVLIGILALTGCQKDLTKNNGNQPVTETQKENTEKSTESETEAVGFSYGELSDYQFNLSSGAGAWHTELFINRDGSFYGTYSDAEMGDVGDDYPNGSVYYSSFKGQFQEPKEIGENMYELNIESVKCANEPGTEDIDDGVRYVYTNPAGIVEGNKLVLYVKGYNAKEFDDNILSWINMTGYQGEKELNGYVLFDEDESMAFYGDYAGTPMERAKQIVSDATDLEDEYNAKLQEEMTQIDMNILSYKIYQVWDGALNNVWAILKNTLDADEFEKIKAEQKEWLVKRDEVIKEAGKESEGGSIKPCLENDAASSYTKERVSELVEYLK